MLNLGRCCVQELFGEKDWLLPAEVDVAEMRRWVKGRESALLSNQAKKGEMYKPQCAHMPQLLVTRVQMLNMEVWSLSQGTNLHTASPPYMVCAYLFACTCRNVPNTHPCCHGNQLQEHVHLIQRP
jgi:hypothetical protein